ncbi:hypothetical protein [Streptomyces violaceus]
METDTYVGTLVHAGVGATAVTRRRSASFMFWAERTSGADDPGHAP